MREILFVAGDPSGEQHAAAVARELRTMDPELALAGVGGDAMRSAGVELIEHSAQLAVFGFAGIARLVPRLHQLLRRLRRRLATGRVACVVLVDYGGFNLGFVAAAAHRAGVPVLYYITPQVWASRPGRIERLRRWVTRAAVIFPFEETLLRQHGVNATFVGHPLADRAESIPSRAAARHSLGVDPDARVLALLPGSRRAEIARHLQPFVETALELRRRDPELQVVVSGAPNITIDPARCPFPIVRTPSLTLLKASDAALCKSGTTTLEAAVAGCPFVLGYRLGRLDYAVARRVVRVRHIGLVNIVAGREIVPEFVQDALRPEAVAAALAPLLDPVSETRARMLTALDDVRTRLGTPGASHRVAEIALALAGGSGVPAETVSA